VPVPTLRWKTEEEEEDGVCLTWKSNVEQYRSFGCDSRVSGRAQARERGKSIGACDTVMMAVTGIHATILLRYGVRGSAKLRGREKCVQAEDPWVRPDRPRGKCEL
jgi:hypothetical protein